MSYKFNPFTGNFDIAEVTDLQAAYVNSSDGTITSSANGSTKDGLRLTSSDSKADLYVGRGTVIGDPGGSLYSGYYDRAPFSLEESWDPSDGAFVGMINYLQFESTSNNSEFNYGMDFEVFNTGSFDTGSLSPLYLVANNSNTGTLGSQQGLYVDSDVSGSGTTNSMQGVRVRTRSLSGHTVGSQATLDVITQVLGGSTVTNAIGISIGNVSGASNSYAIQSGTGLVEHGDAVSIIGSQNTVQFSVKANPTQTGNNIFEIQDDLGNADILFVNPTEGVVIGNRDSGGTNGGLQVKNGISIGSVSTAPASNASLDIVEQKTTGSNYRGYRNLINVVPTTSGLTFSGIESVVRDTGGNTTNIGNFFGINSSFSVQGAQTTSNGYAVNAGVNVTNASAILTRGYGINIASINSGEISIFRGINIEQPNGGTVGTATGLYIGDIDVATANKAIETNSGYVDFGGGHLNNVTTVNAATYDLDVDDYMLNVTYTSTGAVTSLTLPTAQTISGRRIIIKDGGFNASINNITIDTEGSETIDGDATWTINGDGDWVGLISDGTNWQIIG